MSGGEIAGLIAAVAFVALVAVAAVPLLKLGRVLEELRLAVRDIGHESVPILTELRGTVRATNEELVKLSVVTEDAARVSRNATVVTPCATVTATSNGRSAFMSCVSSSAKIEAVNGARIVPPRIAAIAISGQNPTPSSGRNAAAAAPSAPPIISSGARTPPDVPEPRAMIQIVDLTSRMPRISRPVACSAGGFRSP